MPVPLAVTEPIAVALITFAVGLGLSESVTEAVGIARAVAFAKTERIAVT